MGNRVFEVLLDRVEVKETGGQKAGRHMVMASLVWPRPRIAERVAVKTVDIEKGVVDLKKARWTDRIVFKELIDGPFGLEFGVTERVTESQFREFLRFMSSSVLKVAGGEAEDMMSNALLGGVVKVPFQFLAKMISDSGKDGPKVIASGSLDLHSEETWKKNESKQFKVPLTAPETIYKVTRRRREGTFQTRRRKLIEAGADNGVIVFTGKVYG